MWFNILKDGDKLWNERTLSLFIRRLENIFDRVETNSVSSAISFEKEYEDEEGNVWKLSSYMPIVNEVKRGKLNIKYYVDGKHWDGLKLPFFTYNNLSELLDDLELLDKRLTAFFSNMGGLPHLEPLLVFSTVRHMVEDIMGIE